MATRYAIHPSIGVARVGTSEDSFYLAPETIGGLPIECDDAGNPRRKHGKPVFVGSVSGKSAFKDSKGGVRRQAALFKVYAHEEKDGRTLARELSLDEAKFEWTVHVANKKAAWYQNQEFDGNLMFGPNNSYAAREVPLRNAHVTGVEQRRLDLIIDPGPRTVRHPGHRADFSSSVRPDPPYPHVSFPKPGLDPDQITTLGCAMMNASGHLVVLGGHGFAGGKQVISTYTGADTWFDDISDGPVTCRVTLKGSKKPIELTAWVMVSPPKFAPELRNISTLDDVIFDVAVRHQNLIPELFNSKTGWNPDYRANYERDIRPIIERPGDYVWVANVPTMIAFSRPRFDPTDASEGNRQHRENYVRYFRDPGDTDTAASHQQLFHPSGLPLMPLNSGSNSVTNDNIDKFMTLTPTQYQLLKLWADGKFVTAPPPDLPGDVHALDRASAGNCVGHPMSPGVETSWNMRNPAMYSRPFQVRHRSDADYAKQGLDPLRDECEGGGCEPGDLTKRMSPPWQSDLYQCSIEWINFDNTAANYTNPSGIPDPPAFQAYWWPPQAPMYVMSGAIAGAEQAQAGITAGQQVPFMRGLDNIARVVLFWQYLGFIVNENRDPDRADYPTFVERERSHEKFAVTSVAVGQAVNQMAASGIFLTEDNYFVPMWSLKSDRDEVPSRRPVRDVSLSLHRGPDRTSGGMMRRHRGR